MHQVRKFILLSAACLTLYSISTVSAAETPQPGKKGPEAMSRGKWGADELNKRMTRMTRALGLTEEQKEKIKPILDAEYAQLEKLRGNDTYNRDERRAKLQELNESSNKSIVPLLTPEQQTKFEEIRKNIKERRHQERGSKPGPEQTRGAAFSDPERRLSHLATELKLTEEQQTKIKPILAEEFEQLGKLRGNDAMNRDERRARLQELNQVTSEKIKALLTPEQQKQYEAIKKKIMDRRSLKKGPKTAPPPVK